MQDVTEEYCGCAKLFWGQLTLAMFAVPMSLRACLNMTPFFSSASVFFLPGVRVKQPLFLSVWNIATVLMHGPRWWLILTGSRRRSSGTPRADLGFRATPPSQGQVSTRGASDVAILWDGRDPLPLWRNCNETESSAWRRMNKVEIWIQIRGSRTQPYSPNIVHTSVQFCLISLHSSWNEWTFFCFFMAK